MSSHFCRNAFCFSHCARFFFYLLHNSRTKTANKNEQQNTPKKQHINRQIERQQIKNASRNGRSIKFYTQPTSTWMEHFVKKETNSNGKYNQNDRCQQFYLLFYAHTMFKGIKNRIKIKIDLLCVSIYFLCTLLFPQHPSHTKPIPSSVFSLLALFFFSWLFSKYKMIGNKKHLSIRTI